MPGGALDRGLRDYLVVTAGYWAFTLTDGAIRMLVVLYFRLLGYWIKGSKSFIRH
jgi:hypothetical protein